MKIYLFNGDYIIAITIRFALNTQEIIYFDARNRRHVLAMSAIDRIES